MAALKYARYGPAPISTIIFNSPMPIRFFAFAGRSFISKTIKAEMKSSTASPACRFIKLMPPGSYASTEDIGESKTASIMCAM